MFYVYNLYSSTLDQWCIGQSVNLYDRIFRPNNLGSKSMKKANEWILKYKEVYGSGEEVLMRENQIKNRNM
jgi:hypothetical protein